MTYSYEIYEILKDLELFCPAPNLRDAVNSLAKEDLLQLSNDVVKFHKENLPHVLEDLKRHRKTFNAYPLSARRHVMPALLRPLCLYAEKIVVRDPVYDSLFNPAYVEPNIEAIKAHLQWGIPYLLETEPLVRAGILHFVPFMALKASLIEAVGESIETDLKNEAWKKKIVGNIKYKLYPEKNVLLMSLGKPIGDDYKFFRYGKIVGHEDTKNGALLVKMVSPHSLLDKRFNITISDISSWITSEVNNELIRTTSAINENLLLSEALNTSVVTNHQVYEELLRFKARSSISNAEAKVLPYLTKLNLPFIDNIPLEKVVELREQEHESFHDFRLVLQELCKEIETSTPSDIKTAVQQIVEKALKPQIRALDREFKRIRTHALIRSVPRAMLAFGTLITSISVGIPLISALGSVATLKLFKDVSDEYAEYLSNRMKLKSNSMHFLWRAKRASGLAKRRVGHTIDGFPGEIRFDSKQLAREMTPRMGGLAIHVYENVLEKKKTTNDDEGSS